jgi:hypothetical protein
LGQLGAQEGQRALGLYRLLVDVLAHVQARDLVEHVGQLAAVLGLQADVDHARLLAFLDHAQVLLQAQQGELLGVAHQLEGAAGRGVERAHQQVQGAAGHGRIQRHADGALQRRFQVGVGQCVVAAVARQQRELLALEGRGHVHLRDGDALGARDVVAHAEDAGRGQLARVPREELAHHRDVVRLGADVQPRVLHRLAEHHARAQDLGLAGGRRLHADAAGAVGVARKVAAGAVRVLDLDQDVGLVDARTEQGIAHPHQQRQHRDGGDQPAAVDQDVQVFPESGFPWPGGRLEHRDGGGRGCRERGLPTRVHEVHLFVLRGGELTGARCRGRG